MRSGTPQYRSWSRESLTTKTSLRRRGSRAWKRGLSTTETGAENRSEREIGLGDLSDWKAEPFH